MLFINKIGPKGNAVFALILVSFLISISCEPVHNISGPVGLTISEGLIDPVGFYDKSPTFSWKLPEKVKAQSSYSIVVASSPDLLPDKPDLWSSGQVQSDQSIYVKYKGKELASKLQAYWQVKYWDENGQESPWSKAATFELGLLNNSDWDGKWIGISAEALVEKDARIQQVWLQGKIAEVDDVVKFQKGKWDCSDAGMVLYWITGATNGGLKQGNVDDVKS